MKCTLRDERYLECIDLAEGKEEQSMCDLLDEYWNKGISQGFAIGIRNLMDSMKLTLEQAMEALKIPEEERGKYAAMVRKEESAR